MAKKQYDGVIEAVHYGDDGQVDWARGYLRKGEVWSDRLVLRRAALIDALKQGRKFFSGQRREGLAGMFDVTEQLRLVGKDGAEVLTFSGGSAESDNLEGLPVL